MRDTSTFSTLFLEKLHASGDVEIDALDHRDVTGENHGMKLAINRWLTTGARPLTRNRVHAD